MTGQPRRRKAPGPIAAVASALGPVAASTNLRRSVLATFLAYAAEWAFVVVLLVYAYQDNAVLGVALIGMARTIPAAVLAPVLTGAADRLGRHRVLLSVHTLRAAAIAGAALVVAADLPPLAYALAAVEGIAAVLHRPTLASLLPGLARNPDELVASNAATSIAENVGTFIGPAVGGLLAASTALSLALAVPAAAFLGAALLMVRVEPAAMRPRRDRPTARDVALGGIAAITRRPSVRLLVALAAAQTFVRGALTVLLVAASVELLGIGEEGVGYLTSALGAGGLVGAVVAATVVVGRSLAIPVTAGLVAWGLPIIAMGLTANAPIAFALMAVIGVGNAIFDIGAFTLLQRITPNAERNRVFGVLEALIMLTVGAGSAVAPVLTSLLGVSGALVVVGAVLPLVAVASMRGVRSVERHVVLPKHEMDLLRAVPFFAPLPLTVLEQLAGDLVEERVAEGTVLVRQGDIGDRFYILVDGTVEVLVDERSVATLASGDAFGEIALLRDIPRTATVVAREECRVASIDRDAFVSAVSGDRVSTAAANLIVAERTRPVSPPP